MKKCLTCDRKLTPPTSVPRWNRETLAESSRKFYDEQVATRQTEIADEKLGLYGESQFCNKECAAFFGRTAVAIFAHMDFMPPTFAERITMIQKLAERMFTWVRERKTK
jgi:hypothetical protein